MRLFIAIQISEEIRGVLESFLTEMHAIAPQAKWVRAANLHVTLKFLGNTDAQKLPRIQNALRSVHSSQPVTLEFRGLGFFPNEKRPRVFWAGMQSSTNLPELAAAIDHAMHQLDFPLEVRPFTPHLTLARFDPPGLPPKLSAAVKQHPLKNFGSLRTRELHLIESKLKSTGAEYTTVQSFAFVAEP